MLLKEKVIHAPILYPSTYFKKYHAEYCQKLDAVRTEGDFEGWISFYLKVIKASTKDAYKKALEKIIDTPLHYLLVLKKTDEIIGTLQLNFLENLTFQGGRRAQIEGVRIRKDLRGMGLGRKFLLSALQIAKESDAKIVQLTTNKERKEAFSFYKSLGFLDSHEGFKFHF